MKQLITVFLGMLTISGFFLYESLFWGLIIWFSWSVSDLGNFTTLGNITWLQGVAIIFILDASNRIIFIMKSIPAA